MLLEYYPMFCAKTNLLVAILEQQLGGRHLVLLENSPVLFGPRRPLHSELKLELLVVLAYFPLPILSKGTKCKVTPTPTLSIMSPVTT